MSAHWKMPSSQNLPITDEIFAFRDCVIPEYQPIEKRTIPKEPNLIWFSYRCGPSTDDGSFLIRINPLGET